MLLAPAHRWVCISLLLVAPPAAVAAPDKATLLIGPTTGPVHRALLEQSARAGIRLIQPPAVSSVPSQQAVVDRASASRRQAEELFYRLEFDKAVRLLEDEVARSAETLARLEQWDLLRQLHVWTGICRTKQGDAALARRAFAAAALIKDRPPDAGRFPPAVVEAYAQAARNLAAQPKGSLWLQLTPSSARVIVNGRPVAPRSRAVSLHHGEHWVVVRAFGYQPVVRRMRIVRPQMVLELALKPAPRESLALQVAAARAVGRFDLNDPSVAALIGQAFKATEILHVTTEASPGASGQRLTFSRVHCANGRSSSHAIQVVRPGQEPTAVRQALLLLWRTPPPSRASASTPFYKRWWFWTAIGVAVAGGTAAAIAATVDTSPDTYTLRMASP